MGFDTIEINLVYHNFSYSILLRVKVEGHIFMLTYGGVGGPSEKIKKKQSYLINRHFQKYPYTRVTNVPAMLILTKYVIASNSNISNTSLLPCYI